jgi:hypothetical protein
MQLRSDFRRLVCKASYNGVTWYWHHNSLAIKQWFCQLNLRHSLPCEVKWEPTLYPKLFCYMGQICNWLTDWLKQIPSCGANYHLASQEITHLLWKRVHCHFERAFEICFRIIVIVFKSQKFKLLEHFICSLLYPVSAYSYIVHMISCSCCELPQLCIEVEFEKAFIMCSMCFVLFGDKNKSSTCFRKFIWLIAEVFLCTMKISLHSVITCERNWQWASVCTHYTWLAVVADVTKHILHTEQC